MAAKWRSLPERPSLAALTAPGYGRPRERQRPALQELTRAHIESFDLAVGEGLHRAVQVGAALAGAGSFSGQALNRFLVHVG
uniref:Uncharacterized protein n=1 Tax=Gopherus evgoodei TaxID=1825980 RepID=A0A8C4VEP6_9SAUR